MDKVHGHVGGHLRLSATAKISRGKEDSLRDEGGRGGEGGGEKARERKIGRRERLAALSKHAMPRGLRGNMRASGGVHAKYLQATSKQPRRIYYRGAEPSATAILANCHRER